MLSFIETFHEVARLKSFSAAANRLSISQPAVSRQIRLLEEQLGTQLFLRDRQRISLTTAGRELLTKTAPHYEEIYRAISQVSGSGEELSGQVKVACLNESGPFAELLNQFRLHHPKVFVELEFGNNHQVYEAILSGRHELGIVSLKRDSESLRAYPLFEEHFVLITRHGNRTHPRELTDGILPVARYRTSSHADIDSMIRPYLKKNRAMLGIKDIRVEFAVNSIFEMINVVKQSNLYAVVPWQFVEHWIREKKIRVIPSKSHSKPLYLIHWQNEFMAERTLAVKRHLVSECQNMRRVHADE